MKFQIPQPSYKVQYQDDALGARSAAGSPLLCGDGPRRVSVVQPYLATQLGLCSSSGYI